MAINENRSVGALVAERFERANLFDRLGIDYCCHGKLSLTEACANVGLPVVGVVNEIENADAQVAPPDVRDFAAMPLGELADHIEATHHVFMKQEMPRLQGLIAKVAQAHRHAHPELISLGNLFKSFCDEMNSHMLKEERVLFPMVRVLQAVTEKPDFPCGTVDNPIRVMEHEHDNAASDLTQMREFTNGFVTPTDGCASYRSLMDGLVALEADLHRHIHKENNILFPGASRLEAQYAMPRA